MDNSVKSTTPVCRLGIRGDIRCAHLGHAKYMLHKNNGVTFPNPFVEDDTFTEITVGKTWRGILNGVCLHGNVASLESFYDDDDIMYFKSFDDFVSYINGVIAAEQAPVACCIIS